MSSPNEVPETLYGLVAHYSPSGEEREAAGWLAAQMEKLGYDQAYVDEAGSVVGRMGSGARQIVLLGHIDTVPGWIPLRVEDGEFFGRGSVDAKGPLAAFVDAVAQTGPVDGWQIVVVGAAGEEADSRGARFAAGLFHPEYAVIGEPSGWDRLTLGYKGCASFRATARKPVSHSARKEESACEAAFEGWNRIKAWTGSFNQGRQAAFEQLFTSLREVSSGNDGFEEWATLEVSARMPPGLSAEALEANLQAAAAPLALELHGDPIPAFRAEKRSPLVRAFLGAIRSEGGQPGFLLKTGTADLNIVAPAWGCPAAAYGPGDSALDHTAEERISLNEYRQAVDVLGRLLQELTGHRRVESKQDLA